jgi:hypothetical protein
VSRASTIEPFGGAPYAAAQARLGLGAPGDSIGGRRMTVAALVAMAPLVVLATAQGVFAGSKVPEPLLYDFGAIARYLIALPALLAAEGSYLPRMARVVRHLVESDIVAEESRPAYQALVKSTSRLVGSRGANILLLTWSYAVTVATSGLSYPSTEPSWVHLTTASASLTAAGWWRLLVSQPLFQLVLSTLVWRVIVWTRFLWRVSHLRLQLVASHPDHRGGLGFIPGSTRAFPTVGLAIGSVFAGRAAQLVMFSQRPLLEIEYGALGAVGACLLLAVGPMFVFSPLLSSLRIEGLYRYGQLMQSVGIGFEERWMTPAKPPDQDPVGSPDFSSVVDLSGVVANVYAITPVMMDWPSVLPLLSSTLLPFVPVVLLAIGPEQILDYLTKLLL